MHRETFTYHQPEDRKTEDDEVKQKLGLYAQKMVDVSLPRKERRQFFFKFWNKLPSAHTTAFVEEYRWALEKYQNEEMAEMLQQVLTTSPENFLTIIRQARALVSIMRYHFMGLSCVEMTRQLYSRLEEVYTIAPYNDLFPLLHQLKPLLAQDANSAQTESEPHQK